MALVQIFVPAKMILDREDVLQSGVAYKFRTAPIDPNDPFRGKYVALNFSDNTFEMDSDQDWESGQPIFVMLENDPNGFAKIQSVSQEKPSNDEDFLKANVSFISGDKNQILNIYYPFDRYYMEESKAEKAEEIYLESQIDTNQVAYALVHIKNGHAVLKDVMINDTSIREMVKSKQSNTN
jgi:uncharacterized membrane-anchored protein